MLLLLQNCNCHRVRLDVPSLGLRSCSATNRVTGPDLFTEPPPRNWANRWACMLQDKIPKIWKCYFMGKTFAVFSGGKTFQKILNVEFGGSLSIVVDLMEGGLMPTKSVLFEPEKKRHSYLGRLVGAALTPTAVAVAVANAAPTLQSASEEQVSKMMMINDNNNNNNNETASASSASPWSSSSSSAATVVKFQKICTDYTFTLDVVLCGGKF